MDTKSKNSRYSFLALVSLVLVTTLAFLTVVNIYNNRVYLEKEYYFQSYNFYEELTTFAELVKNVHVDYAGHESKTARDKVDKATLEKLDLQREDALQITEERITSEYAPKLDEARKVGKPDDVARLTSEKESQLAKERNKQAAAWEKAINTIAFTKDQEYEDRKNSLSLRNGAIKYYVQDKKNNKIYSNLDHEPTETELRENALYSIRFPQNAYQKSGEFSDLNRSFQLNQWKGVFYVPVSAEGYSQIQADAIFYDSIRERLLQECALLAVSLLIAALLFWYLCMIKAVQLPIVSKSMALLRRIPLDIRIVLLLPVGLFSLAMAFDSSFFAFPIGIEQVFTLGFLSLFTAYFMLHLAEIWQMKNNPESLGQQWQASLIGQIRSLLKESLANKGVFFKVTILVALTIGMGMSIAIGIVALFRSSEEFLLLSFLYAVFYMLVVLPYILRRVGLMNRILLGASQMAAGDLDATIEEKNRGKLASLAHSLNNIKQGLQKSLDSQMKSERLKSELITNVSHDLKTPLTSIINYVDLLKRDDLTAEQLKSYVDVLERKADRLKVLIDDLFEAAKMASGAVELNIEQVNVAALLNQAIAECDDKIEQSSLTFRINIEQQKMYAPLDGKKTWRVFENLISNALKYSLPHTRVHVHLVEQDDKIILTMKNVSAYEIDFDADELLERFKRADQSRNTEGSGLGLAIAKSIVELQGGKLSIEIDGDYFKVIVEFRR